MIFVIAFIAWSIGSNAFQIAELLGIDSTGISAGFESYLLGVVLAIGLFKSVFLDEIAHSILSIKNGIKVEEITLWIFGGMSSMEKIPSDPNLEMKISSVGPLSSLEYDKLVGIVSRSNIMHSFEILKDIERYRIGEI